jgi:hypothetical protein
VLTGDGRIKIAVACGFVVGFIYTLKATGTIVSSSKLLLFLILPPRPRFCRVARNAMFPANFLATPPPPRLFNVIIKSVCCLTAKRQAIIHHDRRDSAATSKEIPAAATRAKDGRFVLICSPTPPDGPDATVFVWRRRRGFPIGAIFVISGPHTSTKLIAPPRAPRTKTAFETPPGDNYVRARGVHQFHDERTKKIQFGKSTPGTGEINP